MKTYVRVSLVIPVYNEEQRITACLAAIARQTVAPFEVIIVDNGSTDDSMGLARAFSFVRVVAEPKRGLVFARDAGFNAARGDVIGRIDADTLLDPNWVETVQTLFAEPALSAISGSIDYYDIPLKRLVGGIDLFFRKLFARRLKGEVFLFGGNMAIRRSAWLDVRDSLCHQRAFHEDFDLAVHMSRQPKSDVRFVPGLHARVSARCVDDSLSGFFTYMMANPRTYAAHGLRSQRVMYWLIAFLVVLYGPIRLLYRASDNEAGRLSLRTFLASHRTRTTRTSPVALDPME